MRCSQAVLVAMACVTLGTGCVSVVLAPGAAEVLVTTNPADVDECMPVGNIRVPDSDTGADSVFRNQVIGLGGNAGLVTRTSGFLPPFPKEGVAYSCPGL